MKKALPDVEAVIGDLENSDLIEQEARNADVVYHLASTRHEVSSRAIIKGLSDVNRKGPGYWIQIGGASMFAGSQIKAGTYGEAPGKVYDDVADTQQIRDVILSSPARVIDNLIIGQDPGRVRTALVVGPIIYGKGSGPGNTRTIQGPAIADYTLRKGRPFQIGQGESVWSTVHVSDLGKLFTLLLQAAISGQSAVWNSEGVIFAENGNTVSKPPSPPSSANLCQSWSAFAKLVSKAAKEQGLIQSSDVESISAEQANEVMAHGAVVLGTNAVIKSSRARERWSCW